MSARRLRGRDVHRLLKGHVEPRILNVLIALADQQSVFQQSLMQMAVMVDQMADIIKNFTTVAENMKSTVDTLKGIDPDDGRGD